MSEADIPKFDKFLAPILRFSGDNKEHNLQETIVEMGRQFSLNSEQMNLLMPNGKRTYLYDRVAWAITYLVQAGLLKRTRRSSFLISDLGKNELKSLPERISYKELNKFPSFVHFREIRNSKKINSSNSENTPSSVELISDEDIETIFKKREEILAEEILDNLFEIKPSDFEKVIIDVVLSLGYGKDFEEMAKAIGQPGDGGIDGEISQDKLGFDKIYLQAKRWNKDQTVTAKDIRDFSGALSGKRAKKGIFITTTKFSKEASEFSEKDSDHKIILINGLKLAELMIENNVGIRAVKNYTLKEIDKDYFESF